MLANRMVMLVRTWVGFSLTLNILRREMACWKFYSWWVKSFTCPKAFDLLHLRNSRFAFKKAKTFKSIKVAVSEDRASTLHFHLFSSVDTYIHLQSSQIIVKHSRNQNKTQHRLLQGMWISCEKKRLTYKHEVLCFGRLNWSKSYECKNIS